MKGIKTFKVSSQTMRLLHVLKRYLTLSRKDINYIQRYKSIFRRVIEAKRKENVNYVLNLDSPTKAMGQLINEEIGTSRKFNQVIVLKTDN